MSLTRHFRLSVTTGRFPVSEYTMHFSAERIAGALTTPPPGYYAHRVLMTLLFGATGEPPAWRQQAACAGQDTEAFFAISPTKEVRELCANCPVAELCREDQMAWEDGARLRRLHAGGMYGGLTNGDRRALRAKRRRGEVA
ncbi:hypothetical protein CNX65_33595 [Actinosynnema pretiosum]|uniref:4Fe-4S Wbl-type domain-containing protein n=1 Tax=Actinosynnema pretiosum TaxID=42197 RepID=A0A290ZF75_9PSEU|nr:hypothetical protein CNX65_33595 [Actinosynnema pretiosum]